MRVVLQRVSRAKISVDGETTGEIGSGMLVLLGVAADDDETDAIYLVDKLVNLRIFDDEAGKMNRSLADVGGGLLIVSQFTLYADSRKGRRPSYTDAAPPEKANSLYEFFVRESARKVPAVKTGRFRATMNVELVNDGPVTIILDSPAKKS